MATTTAPETAKVGSTANCSGPQASDMALRFQGEGFGKGPGVKSLDGLGLLMGLGLEMLKQRFLCAGGTAQV